MDKMEEKTEWKDFGDEPPHRGQVVWLFKGEGEPILARYTDRKWAEMTSGSPNPMDIGRRDMWKPVEVPDPPKSHDEIMQELKEDVLSMIQSSHEMSLTELIAEYGHITFSTILRLTAELVEDGYASHVKHEGDSRIRFTRIEER